MPFFFFNRNVITKNIDLVLLDFSYGSKRHAFKNIRPIMRFHFDCSIRYISVLIINKDFLYRELIRKCTVIIDERKIYWFLSFDENEIIGVK